jgi:hypothetical protein
MVSGLHFILKLAKVFISVAENILPFTLKTKTLGNLEKGIDSVTPFFDKQ